MVLTLRENLNRPLSTKEIDENFKYLDSKGGGGNSLQIGTSSIEGGTKNSILYQDGNGKLNEISNFTFDGTNLEYSYNEFKFLGGEMEVNTGTASMTISGLGIYTDDKFIGINYTNEYDTYAVGMGYNANTNYIMLTEDRLNIRSTNLNISAEEFNINTTIVSKFNDTNNEGQLGFFGQISLQQGSDSKLSSDYTLEEVVDILRSYGLIKPWYNPE
jgi:hypothetical protein